MFSRRSPATNIAKCLLIVCAFLAVSAAIHRWFDGSFSVDTPSFGHYPLTDQDIENQVDESSSSSSDDRHRLNLLDERSKHRIQVTANHAECTLGTSKCYLF